MLGRFSELFGELKTSRLAHGNQIARICELCEDWGLLED